MRNSTSCTCLALTLVLLADAVDCPAQQATIRGSVTLPAVAVAKPRAQRGREYRNRQRPNRKAKSRSDMTRKKQPFAAVVVSAHGDAGVVLKPLLEPAMMEQLDLAFVPRVLPVTVGSTVHFVNYDRIYHNVFSLDVVKMDIGRRETGTIVARQIDQPGAIELFCDIHPQMNGTILSLDTPFFTQPDSTGKFKLGNLPAGRFEIRAFHPDFGHAAVGVELTAGQVLDLDLSFAP